MEQASPYVVEIGSILAETYKVTGLLGRGGMGSVWAAEHLRLPGKLVAIKVLHVEVAEDDEAVARFRREAEIASRLGHPNIVNVLDFNALPDGSPYLVLEHLHGEDLAHRLRKGPLPVPEALEIIRQVGAALAAAHREGIIHRDLKPQNVFLCPTETGGFASLQAKVLDFGISKIRGSQTVKTTASAMLGTPQYMAPEQATGNHDAVDARTDVFALGAMCYEMLSGQPTFGGQTIPEVVFKVVYEPAPQLDPALGCPQAVADAIDKALQKPQEDRFQDVSAFVEALTGSPLVSLAGRRAIGLAGQMGADDALAETVAPPSQRVAVDLPTGAASVHAQPVTSGVMAASGEAAPTELTRKPALVSWRLALVVLAAAGGAAFFWLFRGDRIEAPATSPPMDAALADAAFVPVDAASAKAVDSRPRVTRKPARSKRLKSDKPIGKKKLPIECRDELELAEKALKARNYERARVVARRMRRNTKCRGNAMPASAKQRQHGILARAYCGLRDLGAVRPWFAKLRGKRRDRVIRFCKKFDIDLTP